MSGSCFITTDVIPFEGETGFVGGRTNGAMPQRAAGLFVEGEAFRDRITGEIEGYYWLKTRSLAKMDGRPDDEYLMFAGSVGEIERVLSALVDATANPARDQTYRLPGLYAAYRNRSQIDHDEEASEECYDKLICEVSNPGQGFDLVFSDHRTGSVVARLVGEFSLCRTHDLIATFEALRDFSMNAVREAEQAADLEAEQAPPSP